MAHVETAPNIDVNLTRSDSGVLMQTTITTVKKEAFVDDDHLKRSVENRSKNRRILATASFFGKTAAAMSLVYMGLVGFSNDFRNNDTTGDQRDIAVLALGGLLFVAAAKQNSLNVDPDVQIADAQTKKVRFVHTSASKSK